MKTTAVLKVLKANKQRGGGDAEAETKVKKVSKKKKRRFIASARFQE